MSEGQLASLDREAHRDRDPGGDAGSASDKALSPAGHMDDFSEAKKQAVEQQSRPNAALIHETIRAEGERELQRTALALLLSAFAAGLSMGFSLIVEGILQARLPDAPWRELIVSLGYSVGFLIVVLGRQQLFTENTITPILPLLHHRNMQTFWKVLRLWTLILIGNIAATYVFATVLARTPVFGPDMRDVFTQISLHVMQADFGPTVLKSLFAGWLIALMVWLLPSADSAAPFIIIAITYIVGIAGFSHLIVGSIDAFYAVQVGAATWSDYAFRFFLPTLIGNVTGGVALVAALNYGQVAPEIAHAE